jgi:arsenate reductase
MTVTIFGITNCDTMRKARAWLDAQGIKHALHNYKTSGIDRPRLEAWCDAFGWERVLNRAGTTFRKLPEADREGLTRARAVALMLAQPSLIRRPVLDVGGRLQLGFTPAAYADAFRETR